MGRLAQLLGQVNTSTFGDSPLGFVRVLGIERDRQASPRGYRDRERVVAGPIARLTYTGLHHWTEHHTIWHVRSVEFGPHNSARFVWEHVVGDTNHVQRFQDAVLVASYPGTALLDLNTGMQRWQDPRVVSDGLFSPVEIGGELLLIFDPPGGLRVEKLGRERQVRTWVRVKLKTGEVMAHGKSRDADELHRLVAQGKPSKVQAGTPGTLDFWETEVGTRRGQAIGVRSARVDKRVTLVLTHEQHEPIELYRASDRRFEEHGYVYWEWVDDLLVLWTFLHNKRTGRFLTVIVDVDSWTLLAKLGGRAKSFCFSDGNVSWKGHL